MSIKKVPSKGKKKSDRKHSAHQAGVDHTKKETLAAVGGSAPRRGGNTGRLLMFALVVTAIAAVVYWLTGTGAAPGTPAGYFAEKGATTPNVILITLDTMRADHLPAYGYKGVETPHLDALARDGVVFEQCTSAANLTLPSHCSILTGTYPTYHGIRVNGNTALPDAHDTLAEAFAKEGYATGAFIAAFVLDGRWGLKQGFRHYDDQFELKKYKHIDLGRVQRPANEMVDAALAWMEKEKGKPFFTWLHLYDPHTPYNPPEPYLSRYKDQVHGMYDGEVAFMDQHIGRLVQWLKDGDLYRNTVIVLVGDHGEGLGDHNEMTHGYYIYDYAVHVPLILVAPATRLKGVRVPSQVRTIDVFSTLLEAAGIAVPAANQGESLLPSAFNPTEAKDRPAYSEAMVPELQYGWSALHSIRTTQYKYIDAPKPELYHLKTDPQELDNIWKKEQRIVKKYKKDLELIMKTTAQGAPDPQHANLDRETMQRLATLGYTGGSTSQTRTHNPKAADPKDKHAVYEAIAIASEKFADDDFETAITQLEKVIATDPDIPQALLVLANSYAKVGRDREGSELLDRLLKQDPNNIQALNSLARVLSKMGKKDDVIALCKKAAAVDPLNSQAYTLMGEAYLEDNQYAEALPFLEKSVEIQPKMNRNRLNLAVCRLGLKRYAEASKLLESILTKYPKYPMANFHMALLHEEQGNLLTALKYYQNELKHYENCAEARFNYGKLLLSTGDMEGYLKEMRKMTEIAPNAPKGYLFLARGLLKQQHPPTEIEPLILKGLSLTNESDPKTKALAYYLLADLYNRQNQSAKVQEALKSAELYKNK